jgi:hypothetical protein
LEHERTALPSADNTGTKEFSAAFENIAVLIKPLVEFRNKLVELSEDQETSIFSKFCIRAVAVITVSAENDDTRGDGLLASEGCWTESTDGRLRQAVIKPKASECQQETSIHQNKTTYCS